jgi:hypothetical protein
MRGIKTGNIAAGRDEGKEESQMKLTDDQADGHR